MKETDSELPELLEIIINDEHQYVEGHQKRVAFYSSLNSAILVATIAGAMKSSHAIEYALLITGPILMFVLSLVAVRGTKRSYIRFLEAFTIRMKLLQTIEKKMLLSSNERDFWKDESLLLPIRFTESLNH